MKILNLYAGIGGNRKLWGNKHDITAVEIDKKTAEIYYKYFPDDQLVIGDAHQFLIDHYHEYDFIWASPPCQTHSRLAIWNEPRYPDMTLYQEILFMQHVTQRGLFPGKWVIENVMSYYDPLITPQAVGMHYFWANFYISPFTARCRFHNASVSKLRQFKGFDDGDRRMLRNCTEPELGLHVLNSALSRQKALI